MIRKAFWVRLEAIEPWPLPLAPPLRPNRYWDSLHLNAQNEGEGPRGEMGLGLWCQQVCRCWSSCLSHRTRGCGHRHLHLQDQTLLLIFVCRTTSGSKHDPTSSCSIPLRNVWWPLMKMGKQLLAHANNLCSDDGRRGYRELFWSLTSLCPGQTVMAERVGDLQHERDETCKPAALHRCWEKRKSHGHGALAHHRLPRKGNNLSKRHLVLWQVLLSQQRQIKQVRNQKWWSNLTLLTI